jgi:DNA-binding CsgD family transcriptional regulator
MRRRRPFLPSRRATVSQTLQHIYRKLGVDGGVAAATRAVRAAE